MKNENIEKDKEEQNINCSQSHCISQSSWLQATEINSGSLKQKRNILEELPGS